ncbi:MAG TPA: ABC transporter ATP-binding protein [Blastocatellia bacterium]|nr:ABC transporter ATP-binding protein [Blastocatellia bacterium]
MRATDKKARRMKRAAFGRVIRYWKRHWMPLLVGLGCIFIGNGIGLMAPRIVRDAVNDLLVAVTAEKLGRYAGLVIGIVLVQGIFLFLQRRLIVGMSRDIEYEMRNEIFAHLLRLEPSFYHQQRTGDLMSRATNDLAAVRMMVGPAIMYATNTVAVFSIAIPLMIRVNGRLTALALASLPLVSVATKLFGQRIHDQFEKIQEHLARLSAKAQENFAGVRVIRAYVQEDAERRAFDQLNREYVRKNLRLIRLTGLFYPTLHGLIGLAAVAVLWYGGRLAMQQVITVGQFVEFNLYLVRLIWPVIALGWVVNLFQRGLASLGRIADILEREPRIQDLSRDGSRSPSLVGLRQESLHGSDDHPRIHAGRIEFRQLTLQLDGHRPILRNITLTIEPGETVALVGRTGAGKTVLVSLIPRLLDPPPGTLFIDGHDVRTIPLDHLRASIGMVPQEPFLFSLSIGENIAFGAASATAEEIAEAARQAGLEEDILGFPHGLDTLVGERGITLSGGQKQRTAIARALLRNPRILILDDALSSVDTQTEERILHHLRQVMRGRTSLIISHRISTIRDADKIVVLDQGQIVEEGTHDELLARGGLYADLYEKQLLEEELTASE